MSLPIQRFFACLSFMLIAGLGHAGTSLAFVAAFDDLVEIKPSARVQIISFNQLLANDLTMLGYSIQLGRGADHGTVALASDIFVYQPDDSFWDIGGDSFTYSLSDGDMTSTGTVVLVPAYPPLVHTDGFESEEQDLYYVFQESGSQVSESREAAVSGATGLRVTLDGSGSPGDGYIYFPIWSGGIGIGSGGGEEEPPGGSGIDILARNLGSLSSPGSVVLMSACDRNDEWPRYRVRAWRFLNQIRMAAEVLNDDGPNWHYESTESLTVHADSAHIGLSYWWDENSEQGSARLRVDGQTSSTVTAGLSEGICDEVRVGVMPQSPGQVADIYFDNFYLAFETEGNDQWTTRAPMSDGFENGNFGDWTDVIGDDHGIRITSERAITGENSLEVLPEAKQAFQLLDTSHDPANPIWNVRFALDFDRLSLGREAGVALLAAGDGHPLWARAKASLSVVSDARGVPILRTEFYDSQQSYDREVARLERGPHVVAIQYRSATEPTSDDGFLRIWVDGELGFQALGLQNHDVRIDWFRLGAVTSDTDVQGSLLFDDYMSW